MLDVQTIRNDFPVLQRTVNDKTLVYSRTAADPIAPAGMNVLEEQLLNIMRMSSIHYLSEKSTERLESGRKIAQNFINAMHTMK